MPIILKIVIFPLLIFSFYFIITPISIIFKIIKFDILNIKTKNTNNTRQTTSTDSPPHTSTITNTRTLLRVL